jgi:hypothetical protein
LKEPFGAGQGVLYWRTMVGDLLVEGESAALLSG